MSRTTLERDIRDLAAFGYRQRLDRTLGGFSAFAAGFSYLSVLTGSSQLFHIGYAAGGPAFVWTWPAVFAGQMLVALCFADLASRYPISGGVYQWSKQVSSVSIGWMAGWVYLACAIITLASVALALQTTLPQLSPVFQVFGPAENGSARARNAVLLGTGLIVLSTAINAVGLRLLTRINNAGVFLEMAGTLLLIGLLAAQARRSPLIVFETLGHGSGSPFGYLGPALGASLMASFVLYGFDTAGTLAEETDDPRRRAPRAILLAISAVGLAGTLLVLTALRAAPDLNDPALSSGNGGLPHVVTAVLGPLLGSPFLAVVAFSIFVCALTVHAAAVRLIFAMARDNALPFSKALARIGDGSRTPTLPAILIGLAAGALLVVNIGSPKLIEVMASVAVVWANLAYLFVTAPMLVKRLQQPDAFGLGRLGLAINAAAVVWGVLIVVNIGWPRVAIYGDGPLGRLGAAPATIAMLGTGWLYHLFVRRGRPSGILEDHRTDLLNEANSDSLSETLL